MIKVKGIELARHNNPPVWHIKEKGWMCYTFMVVGHGRTKREDLDGMVGETIFGNTIVGVESCCVENQRGKIISLCVVENKQR